MPNIIFDDDLMYVSANLSETDLKKEKKRLAQDRGQMEKELLNEDEGLRAIAQKRIQRYDTHLSQIDDYKKKMVGSGNLKSIKKK